MAEGHGVGHLDGESSSEGADLFMHIHEECLGLPSALLLDGRCGDSVQVHGHGSSSAQGVATDVALGVAQFAEADGTSGSFDGCIDVFCLDVLPVLVGGALVGV